MVKADRQSSKGFTLIEMLVVMAIILILSLFLYPAALSALRKGQQVQCLSNLRQIGIAFQMYSLDGNQEFPYAKRHAYADDPDSLVSRLSSYIDNQKVWLCPSTEGVFRNQFQLSYVYNIKENLIDPINLIGRPAALSSATWVLIDARRPGQPQPHFGYFANVLWGDGRAEALGP